MDTVRIIEELREYLHSELLYDSEVDVVAEDQDLLDSGLLDSMRAVQLGDHIEETYEIVIDPTDFTFENFQNLRKMADLIAGKLADA